MTKPLFHYCSGEPVLIGDHLTISGVPGIVEQIFAPQTQEAEWHSCAEDGGVFIRTEKWGYMCSAFIDEDYELVRRA